MLKSTFSIKQPSALLKPWTLSPYKDQYIVAVSQEANKYLKVQHVPGIDFLYQNFIKKFKGAILNEENGLNMQLQVSCFLNAIFNCNKHNRFVVLILCPDHLLIDWHYHLTISGGLKVEVIDSSTCFGDFEQEHGTAMLMSFSNIKLLEALLDYHYFSVIIDHFDEVASKRNITKMYGDFNIGLTERNFYIQPDQKLQWTMLNWSNPGCVGKLSEFYKVDSDNFASFRDNYRHWWFRLTWDYCENFKRISEEEKEEHAKILFKWAVTHQLKISGTQEKKPQKRKRVAGEITQKTKPNQVKRLESSNNSYDVINVAVGCNVEIDEQKQNMKNKSSNPEEIIINKLELDNEEYVPLPSKGENPILDSIIKNVQKLPVGHSTVQDPKLEKINESQTNCSKSSNDGSVLMSIINNTCEHPSSPTVIHQAQVLYEKAEILSQLVDDTSCPYSYCHSDEESDFLLSLVHSNPSTKYFNSKWTEKN